jgi:hypothetical protein
MKEPQYFGNYLGIVVQNNDPLRQGRVKVFVPHISPTVYNKWNEVVKDKKFKFLGKNTFSDLTDILDDLKKILPWATLATPLVGESSSGRFNNYLNAGSISDSSNLDTFVLNLTGNDPDSNLSKYSQNTDNIGEKPGNIFDVGYYKLKDAFSDPVENKANNVNKLSFNYTPECYSNCAKGSFPILNVGAHVWVFFKAGDPMFPVIFASSMGGGDFKNIFDITTANTSISSILDKGLDYPGEYENDPLPLTENEDTGNIEGSEYNINTETYRNKYVINQKGGTISFVNSDNRETLKFTHYSGSFKEFNNQTNIEFAANNDQELILGDQFSTVRGTRNEFTELDYDCIIKGDKYKKIGNLRSEIFKLWKNIYEGKTGSISNEEMGYYKEIFQRYNNFKNNLTLNVNQLESNTQNFIKGLASEKDSIPDLKQLFEISRCDSFENSSGIRLTSSLQRKNGNNAPCPVCNSEETKYFVYNNKIEDNYINIIFPSTADSTGDFPLGRTLSIDGIINSVQDIGTQHFPEFASALTNLGFNNGPGKIFGITCPACGGSGISPSSHGGIFNKDNNKANLKSVYERKIKKLLEIEKLMGVGGSEIIDITKHKVETIGMVMNDSGAIRVDMKGKMQISDVLVAKYGTFYNRTPTPLVELVHVDDYPGGNYTLNVCNKFNVLVGAGGIALKSYGVVNISGALTNVAGEQVNISSELETNIDGGKRLSLTADVVSIKNRNLKQVVVEGSLGVTHNVTVAGGLHVEGELTANHITIPREIQCTEQVKGFARPTTDVANLNGLCTGFGVLLNSPPLPQGDSGTLGEFSLNPAMMDTGAPWIGFTDAQRICGRLIQELPIGYVKAGSITSVGADPQGGVVEVININDVPVYASATGAPGGGDTPVFGSGVGSAGQWPPVGAAPYDGCIKAVKSSFTSNIDGSINATPAQMNVMLFGTGASADSIQLEPHSHMFKGIASTIPETNAGVRNKIVGIDAPINCEPISNSCK